MITDVVNGDRLAQLRELLTILAAEIDAHPGARDLAGLIKQYRETMKEIEELEGGRTGDDEIGEIINRRAADGKTRAVRKGRTAVS